MNIQDIRQKHPYSCYIDFTESCNLRCRHCYGNFGASKKGEMRLEDWKKVIDDLIKAKVFYVNISGGEPTFSPYFKDFIQYLNRVGMHYILTTNGVFSEDTAKFIVKNSEYMIGIKISLDGFNEKTHGFIRLDSFGKENPEVFKTTFRNILFFKKHKLPMTIATILHVGIVKKMEKFMELIEKINPISWFVSPLILSGRAVENKGIGEFYDFYNIKFWQNLQRRALKKRINLRLIDLPVEMGKEGLSAYSCAGAINFCDIHCDGTVSPCALSRVCIPKDKIKFDNIKEKSLQEIWDGEAFEKFRSYMNVGCEGCQMISKCNKCVAQSFKYFGDGQSPTPFCVRHGYELGLINQEEYKKILSEKFKIAI